MNATKTIQGVEEFINGSRVNVEMASEFSKKSWKSYSQWVSDHISPAGTDQYDLSDRFLRMTRYSLKELIEKEKVYLRTYMRASDILAAALCRAAQSVGPPPEEPDDASGYWLDGQPIWGADRPILEAWAGLGPLKVPWDVKKSLKLNADTGKWVIGPARLGVEIHDVSCEETHQANDAGFYLTADPPAPDYTDPSVVRIVRIFEKQKNFLPKLTIEVEGAPICLLMEAFNSQVRGKTVRKEAENLWKSIVSWLAGSSGFKKAKRGRPSMGLGQKAAFLHHHYNLPWSKVALKLCPQQHQHNRKCRENFRKQAEQYWRALEKKCRLAE